MLGFAEGELHDILAHGVFVCGYVLLLAEVLRVARGLRVLRRAAIALGAILLAGAHGFVAWQQFEAHPYSSALKSRISEQVQGARKAGEELIAEVNRQLRTPRK